jgi:hypothetical protein
MVTALKDGPAGTIEFRLPTEYKLLPEANPEPTLNVYGPEPDATPIDVAVYGQEEPYCPISHVFAGLNELP